MKNTFLFITICFLAISGIKAQSTDDFTYYANYTPVDIQGAYDTVYETNINILESSVTNFSQVYKINVKIGTYSGGYNIFDFTFKLENLDSLPSGMSYKREDGKTILTLGKFLPGEYFYAVSLEFYTGDIIGPVIKN